MNTYLDLSGKAMLAVLWTYDNARSAEKMTSWDYLGNDHIAWQEGPCLSSPANKKQIDHTHPYCFKTSREHGIVAGIVLGPNPPKELNGGVKIPLPPLNTNSSRVEPVIAKLAIIEQFEFFKDLMIRIDGPYNDKSCKAWKGKVEDNILNTLTRLTNRRNELTHDSNYKLPSINESIEYFYQFRQISKIINQIALSRN